MSAASYVLAAQKVSVEIRKTFKRLGWSQRDAAKKAGVDPRVIWDWYNGRTLPTVSSITKLRDATGNDRLFEMVVDARTFRCERPGCENTMVAHGRGDRVWCSMLCRKLAYKASNYRAPRKSERRSAFEIRRDQEDGAMMLQIYQGAVNEFCRSCEPDGFCRTPECSLRAVSPLRLEPRFAKAVS